MYYGKLTAETMLHLQFIRGLGDSDTHTKLLQTEPRKKLFSNRTTFQEVINIDMIMELSKSENTMNSASQH